MTTPDLTAHVVTLAFALREAQRLGVQVQAVDVSPHVTGRPSRPILNSANWSTLGQWPPAGQPATDRPIRLAVIPKVDRTISISLAALDRHYDPLAQPPQ